MNIGELKTLVNAIESKYDEMTIHDGNKFVGAPEVNIEIEILNHMRRNYCDVTCSFVGGVYTREFSDISEIAAEIAAGRKIHAIKAMRGQFQDTKGFPLSLRKSKDYIDRYLPMGYSDIPGFNTVKAAERFVSDHLPEDFLEEEEMTI